MQDQDDLVHDFVTEAKEHMGSVEADLLRLEQNLDQADADTINRLFRSVHSVKGAAGFLGFGQVQKLSHALEGTLDLLRKDLMQPSKELIDVFLQATDQLASMIAEVSTSEQADVDANVEKLSAFRPGAPGAPSPASAAPEPKFADVSAADFLKWTSGGRNLYHLELPLAALGVGLGKPISELPDVLGGLGEVVRGATKLCEVTSSERAAVDPLHVLFATSVDGFVLQRTLGLDAQWVNVVPAPPGAASAPVVEVHDPAVRHEPTPAPVPADTVAAAPDPAEHSAPAEHHDEPAAHAAPPRAAAATGTQKPTHREAEAHSGSESIRVAVGVLDRLMNLSGELVLGRNQLLQALSVGNALDAIAARLSHVVSETQEVVMQTRMQPVGNLFGRFPRVVRDLAGKLKKQCKLEIEGKDVELDRSLLEALADPMTHLVRNSIDHGIEMPEVRERAGKSREGTLHMSASHQGGDVKILIRDNGRGIDHEMLRRKAVEKGVISADAARALSEKDAVNLIFHPGFSTAEKVTDVSGRGVGMDVVRSNVERLGGSVDVETRVGHGTTIAVTLPLTLAILPALVVAHGPQRYVVPQANVAELVRLRADEMSSRIVPVGGRDILRLRGALLPLVHLTEVLGTQPDAKAAQRRVCSILVIASGSLRYGLVVSAPPDAEEIVVKPLGRHLKNRPEYSGATILGDGRVAMILDVAGLPELMQLKKVADELAARGDDKGAVDSVESTEVVLLRVHDSETFAVPLCLVRRIQRVSRSEIQQVGRELVFASEARVLPLLQISDHIGAKPADEFDRCYVLVLRVGDQEVGLIAPILMDVRRIEAAIDDRTLVEPGVLGSFQIGTTTVRLLDVSAIALKALPHLCAAAPTGPVVDEVAARPRRLLLAEDSSFFRAHVQRILEEAGFEVESVEDGDFAWKVMVDHGERIDLVLTDVEMPNCDGLELTRRIRGDARFANLSVIALTSLSSDQAMAAGRAAGVTEYLVKLDDHELVSAVQRTLGVVA